jgi:hypothetical protein
MTGKPGMPPTNGYSTGVPMAWAKVRNCPGVSYWVAQKGDAMRQPGTA